jgi:hypothetical protein
VSSNVVEPPRIVELSKFVIVQIFSLKKFGIFLVDISIGGGVGVGLGDLAFLSIC